jgi:hypothetical protein
VEGDVDHPVWTSDGCQRSDRSSVQPFERVHVHFQNLAAQVSLCGSTAAFLDHPWTAELEVKTEFQQAQMTRRHDDPFWGLRPDLDDPIRHYYAHSPRIFDVSNVLEALVTNYDGPSYWHSSANSQIVAEIAMELVAFYIMGRILHFGVTNKFYQIGDPMYIAMPPVAHLMYAGAMWYLTAGACVAIGSYFVREDHTPMIACGNRKTMTRHMKGGDTA